MVADWKQSVAHAFGRAAQRYDEYADLQHDVAERLAHRIVQLPLPPRPRILEIGCGTGFLARTLARELPDSRWVITDLSLSMVEQCRRNIGGDSRFQYACMDGEAPALRGTFDLVCSSLALQWFAQLPGSIPALLRLARPGSGHLAYATLIRGTFREWIDAHHAIGLNAGTPTYPAATELQALWPAGNNGHLETEHIRRRYRTSADFLDTLRRVGANTPAPGHAPLEAGTLRRLLRSTAQPSGFEVTYAVAYGTFARPNSSDQAPTTDIPVNG